MRFDRVARPQIAMDSEIALPKTALQGDDLYAAHFPCLMTKYNGGLSTGS